MAANQFLDLFHQEYNEYLTVNAPSTTHKGYMPSSYADYLKRDQAEEVHSGYFSIDKNKKLVEPSLKRGKEDSDDISAYDLIMKDKVRLLSFEEPTRFIFSHSALKEGWDNPNVFQICALKQSDSTSRRRQEVGRGMRLCVNKQGIRQDYETIGELVHEVNKLTVVASESYETFAKALQSEIVATLKDRPQKADVEYFIGKLVTNESGRELRLTKDHANRINKILYKHDIVDEDDKITDIGKTAIESGELPLPEDLSEFKDGLVKLLKAVYSGEPPILENDRNTVDISLNKNFYKQEFKDLWEKINIKTIYEVQFDTEKLIEDSKNKINADLHIAERTYEVRTGELKEGTKQEYDAGVAFNDTKVDYGKLKADIYTDTVYDIVGEIVTKTNLTRKTIVAILQKIQPQKFALIRRNPEEFIAKVGKLVNEVKASLIINNIVYHKTEESYDASTVFSNSKAAVRQSDLLEKHIYDFLTTDSEVETKFAKELENSTAVTVYAKLPKSFVVTTPVANYSPDWAIVFDKDKVRHIYFVAETKGSVSNMDLRGIENLKIHCATEHFKAISDTEVMFHKVENFAQLLEIVQPT
jgi:type III restriction enzyme